ncbi:MAG: ATP synthase subunit I [Thalassolituus sp.]
MLSKSIVVEYRLSSIPRPPVYRIVLLQLILTLICGALAWIHSDVAAYSALLGGLTCALPNAYFIWRSFRYSGARMAAQVLKSFYQAESWKFVLTALCFGVIFQRVEPLNVLALFAAFVTVQLGHLASTRIANL